MMKRSIINLLHKGCVCGVPPKLTAFILVVGCLIAGLQSKAQIVSVDVKDANLESVLKQFKKQTGYRYFVDEPTLKKAAKVTLNLQYVLVSEALEKCFATQPNLNYSIVGKIIVVSEKKVSNSSNAGTPGPDTSATPFTINGLIYNRRHEPLANASVMLQGTKKGTMTSARGSFTLPDGKAGDVLRVSFIGYKTKDLIVPPSEKLITIIMDEANNELDEVVAQGYSKTTRRLSTSSVAKVSGEEIARQPVMDPLLALQGKVPGMVVTPVSTYNGSPVMIDIRGRGLLSDASENPMIIIDGIPMGVGSNKGVAFGDGPVQGLMAVMSPAGSQSPLFGLNPKDILSIEILKDVGATAIYGSLGANGVILITTNRGKAGGSRLSVNVNSGISKVTRNYDLLNTPQYLEMRREALRNDGLVPTEINAPDLMRWDTTRYTDWQRELWGRTAATLDATVSYSGGTPLFSHKIAANYMRVGEISRVSGKNEAIGVNIALDRKSENQKFSTALTVGYTHTFLNMISAPNVTNLPPNAPPIFDQSGNLNFKDWAGTGFESNFNTFGALLKPFESSTNTLTAGFNLSYQLMKGLTLSSSVSYRSANNHSWNFVPIRSQNPASKPTGSSSFSKGGNSGWSFAPQLTYQTRLLGKGNLSLSASGTLRTDVRESVSSRATGFTNDATLRSFSMAPVSLSDYYYTRYKYASVNGRMEYVWDNKYVVNGIWTRDGSSRFAPGKGFGDFKSVGIAWMASDEEWLKKVLSPVINFLKFYANMGTAGNDGGGDYQYLSQWARGSLVNYDNVVPIKSLHAVNQFYQWQLTKEFNIGMQMNLIGTGKLQLAISYYRSRVSDQLTNNPTPIYTGFSSVFGNWNATVENSGWEISLSSNIINKKNFRWSGSVNASFNRNRLLEYPQIEKTPDFSRYLVGQTLTTRYLLRYIGIDPMTGSYQYEDYNKDGLINSSAVLPPLTDPSDKQMIVDDAPVVSGGISQSFTYKALRLAIGFDYRIQKGVNAFASVQTPGQLGNIPVEIFNNRWQKTGDNARYARLTTGPGVNYARGLSTIFYSDASYLRFNNISLGYDFPMPLIRRLGMQSCTFNINTRNIFTISKYKGVDPEIRNFGGRPPVKVITLGFSATF